MVVNLPLLLITLIIAYVMMKRWADKPAPAKTAEIQSNAKIKITPPTANRPEQTGTSALWPWLVLFGCAAIFGITVSATIMATAYAVKLGLRMARQRGAERNRLIADATKQHNQVMSGDDAGIYGNYPPAC
ncbi:hypothetical protein ABW16_04200 [Mycolicibacter heraklionensis]|uniref:Uncharacterized protein n=1 Tax=Mycolicibacter heraklionensis TaxID=512402 RepID=A0ABR5FJ39_9MYCO|nr:hypothetical protein [Mycolicibacter heraklionensis]KLO30913.1 hypothetical protein ABW16_04200 [Mycolicibacter heraklionensis]